MSVCRVCFNWKTFVADDYGRKIRGQHMVAVEKRYPRNTKEKQFRVIFRRAVPKRLHDGATQTRRKTIQRSQRRRHTSSRKQSESSFFTQSSI